MTDRPTSSIPHNCHFLYHSALTLLRHNLVQMLRLSSVELSEIKQDDLELKWEYLEQFKLGGGGFADVFHVFYKGHDAVLKRSIREYTVKEKEEIRREASVIAALNNCSNVIRIYGICDTAPFHGMIMEYCAGPNLAELVFQLHERGVKVETLRVFKWCHALSRTLCELNLTHYHGDVKAQNVLVKEKPCLCPEGTYNDVKIRDTTYFLCSYCNGVHLEHLSLKICDFGMSCAHGTKRKYRGTREFSAPETIQEVYTEKSEVYSFGHLMLVLVIGKPTEECADGQRIFLELHNNRKYDLSECKSNSICETIAWCLKTNPEHRPTFKELLLKLNGHYDHYTNLKSISDRRSQANIEREEFLDYYNIPRKITMAHRSLTTSSFLSISTDTSGISNDVNMSNATYYGGPLDNVNFVHDIDDIPLHSFPNSYKYEDGNELARSFVENEVYTGDEWVPRNQTIEYDYHLLGGKGRS